MHLRSISFSVMSSKKFYRPADCRIQKFLTEIILSLDPDLNLFQNIIFEKEVRAL